MRRTLIILPHQDAGPSERSALRSALSALGLSVEDVDLGTRQGFLVPDDEGLPAGSLARLPGVEKVLPLGSHTRLVEATRAGGERCVRVGTAAFGAGQVGVIAGPCTIESLDDLLETARLVREAGAVALRGGVFKVRTSPHDYQGGGLEALRHLEAVAREVQLPFFTELNDPRQVAEVGDRIDGIQIGARHMQNFPLLREAAATGKPILLKRHMAADVDEWLLAAEYILAAGNEQIILCERGVRSPDRHVRYLLDVGVVPYLKARVGLPVIVDPSHAAGHHALVPALARAAIAAGADGLIVEVHPAPERTRCDALQALPPSVFADLMADVAQLAAMSGRSLVTPGDAAGDARPLPLDNGHSAGRPYPNRAVGA